MTSTSVVPGDGESVLENPKHEAHWVLGHPPAARSTLGELARLEAEVPLRSDLSTSGQGHEGDPYLRGHST
jgi:hypothetical protein